MERDELADAHAFGGNYSNNNDEAGNAYASFCAGWDARQAEVDTITRERDQAREACRKMRAVVEAAKELRIYCLGSDCSTLSLMERFDSVIAALAADGKEEGSD